GAALRIRLAGPWGGVPATSRPPPGGGNRGCRSGGNPGRAGPPSRPPARPHRAARYASRTPMRFHRPHQRLRALNPRPRTRQTALTPRNAVFGTGAAFTMMADSHLVFNVLTTGRGDVRFGPKADIFNSNDFKVFRCARLKRGRPRWRAAPRLGRKRYSRRELRRA